MTTFPSVAAVQADEGSSHLLARAREGDAESFGELCEPFRQRLVRQALVLCRDEDLARDLAQETLVAAWRSIGRYNGRCQFGTWLCSILLHKHKSALRRSRWLRLFASFSGDPDDSFRTIEDGAPQPDHAAEISERAGRVLGALSRLPARQREVVFLRFYADESIEGIAAAMNCSEGTIKSRLFHGLENLRRMSIIKEELR